MSFPYHAVSVEWVQRLDYQGSAQNAYLDPQTFYTEIKVKVWKVEMVNKSDLADSCLDCYYLQYYEYTAINGYIFS